MNAVLRMRSIAAILLLMLLGGCAGTGEITGRFSLDTRPASERTDVYWPPSSDMPRYRYLGELVGELNFTPEKSANAAVDVLKWLVGVFDPQNPAQLQRPQHGTVSENGRIYIVDAGSQAVFVFDPITPRKENPKNPNNTSRNNEPPKDNEGQMLTWNMAGEFTRFASPVAVTIAWDGDIAVSDAKLGIVARINNQGLAVGSIGAGKLERPTGVAFDRESGLLFVADTATDDIKVFDRDGKLVNTIGATGEGKGQFNAPTHLAFSRGHLYVSDTLNSRVQVFDAQGRYIRDFGERGINVGNLVRPKGIAVSDGGISYVVESYFGHLLVFNEQNQLLLSINGSGLKDGNFRLPSGVWTDHNGRIFVADMFNGRIVVYQFLGDDGD